MLLLALALLATIQVGRGAADPPSDLDGRASRQLSFNTEAPESAASRRDRILKAVDEMLGDDLWRSRGRRRSPPPPDTLDPNTELSQPHLDRDRGDSLGSVPLPDRAVHNAYLDHRPINRARLLAADDTSASDSSGRMEDNSIPLLPKNVTRTSIMLSNALAYALSIETGDQDSGAAVATDSGGEVANSSKNGDGSGEADEWAGTGHTLPGAGVPVSTGPLEWRADLPRGEAAALEAGNIRAAAVPQRDLSMKGSGGPSASTRKTLSPASSPPRAADESGGPVARSGKEAAAATRNEYEQVETAGVRRGGSAAEQARDDGGEGDTAEAAEELRRRERALRAQEVEVHRRERECTAREAALAAKELELAQAAVRVAAERVKGGNAGGEAGSEGAHATQLADMAKAAAAAGCGKGRSRAGLDAASAADEAFEQLQAQTRHAARAAIPKRPAALRLPRAVVADSAALTARAAADLVLPEGLPGNAERFVDPLVCKGFANQVMAFVDAAATAWLLNATLVLPQFYTHYDYLGTSQERTVPLWNNVVNYDPQRAFAVAMDFFFDVPHFKQRTAGLLRTADALPQWLQGDDTWGRRETLVLQGDRPSQLSAYLDHLAVHPVLRLKCTLHSLTYATRELGAVHARVLSALRPAPQFADLVEATLDKVQAAVGREGTFAGLHLRHEADWLEYCKRELRKDPEGWTTGITSLKGCYMDAEGVAHVLKQRDIAQQLKAVYIASGVVDNDTTAAFEALGLRVLHRGNTWGVQGGRAVALAEHRELCAALDFWVMRVSDLFVGNVYSSFSWLVRELDYITRSQRSTPSRALYYNTPLLYTRGDVMQEETIRWNVLPGVLRPEWAPLPPQGAAKRAVQPDERCTSVQCQKEQLRHATEHSSSDGESQVPVIDMAEWSDTGHMVVEGTVPALQRVALRVEGRLVAQAWANHAGEEGEWGFVLEARMEGASGKSVEVRVCAVNQDGEVCTPPYDFVVGFTLQRGPSFFPLHASDEGYPDPVIYVHYPHPEHVSGGPEALHQLHMMINRLYKAGEIGVRSVFPLGSDVYKSEHSDFGKFTKDQPFDPGSLGPWDYMVVPEHTAVDELWDYAASETGFQPLVYYLGQHVDHYVIDLRDKPGFKPLCLNEYFATQHDCGAKGVLNTPMADVLVRAAADYQALPNGTRHAKKRDVVLFDPDDMGNFDITNVQVPDGVRLVELHGVKREQMASVYKSAKVLVDSYITGMERALFEGALFDVVPLLAHHGPARDAVNFPLAQQYKWHPWDYATLNALIADTLARYEEAVDDLAPMQEYTRAMGEAFQHQVRSFFSDDVHLYACALPRSGSERDATYALGATGALLSAVAYPFASYELATDSPFYFGFDEAGPLSALEAAGYGRGVTASATQPEYKAYHEWAHYLQRPRAKHLRRYALLLPYWTLPLHPDLPAAMLKVARSGSYAAVLGPGGLVLVDVDPYYKAVTAYLGAFKQHGFTLDLLKRVLVQAGLPVHEVTGQTVVSGKRACSVETLSLGVQPQDMCYCDQLTLLLAHPLWRAAEPRFAAAGEVLDWLGLLMDLCEERRTVSQHIEGEGL